MHRIPERVDSTFRYVLLAARRAEQLMRGGRPKVELPAAKPARLAMAEVSGDLVEWDYGPPPEPEPLEEVDAAAEEESA